MGLDLVPTGKNPPDELNVIIEIPKDAEPVKARGRQGLRRDLRRPRAVHPDALPPATGYVPHTLCGDGDPADVLVLMPLALDPRFGDPVRPVGVLRMVDEAGSDEKILAVPISKVLPRLRPHRRCRRRCPSTGWTASATSSSTAGPRSRQVGQARRRLGRPRRGAPGADQESVERYEASADKPKF